MPLSNLNRTLYKDFTETLNIGEFEFDLRTLFCYTYEKETSQDRLPSSLLQITNAGVKVFGQSELLLKPGRKYIWSIEGESKEQSYYRRNESVINHFWIVLDFKKGRSPILPSRVEIDIEADFSTALMNILIIRFCNGLSELMLELQAEATTVKLKRKKILDCLIQSIKEQYRSRREIGPPTSLCEVAQVESSLVNFYRIYGVYRVLNNQNEERLLGSQDVDIMHGGFFVLDSVTKSALFRVYTRAFDLKEWIVVDNWQEYVLFRKAFPNVNWKGIYNDRDIYAERKGLFSEKTDAAIARFLQGDYALIDSDIFGKGAFIVLPSTLRGTWKRADAIKNTRIEVAEECPARVLLNASHPIFEALEEYASRITSAKEDEVSVFRSVLQNLMDSVIEQDRTSVAEERWNSIRKDLTRLTGKDLTTIRYKSLRG